MKADRLAKVLTWAVLFILALVVVFAVVKHSEASSDVPPTLRAAVRVTGVYCSMGCCCGTAQTVYMGHWYDRPLGYCRWFRQLREGETVVTTLTLAR